MRSGQFSEILQGGNEFAASPCMYFFPFFAEHHYLLELNLAQPEDAERWVQGFLKVNLYGTQSEITDIDLTEE